MFIHVEVPRIVRLQAYDRSELAVVRAVCFDDADIVQAVMLCIVAKHFADLLAAAFFAFFACADVQQFWRCVLFLRHVARGGEWIVRCFSRGFIPHLSGKVCTVQKEKKQPLTQLPIIAKRPVIRVTSLLLAEQFHMFCSVPLFHLQEVNTDRGPRSAQYDVINPVASFAVDRLVSNLACDVR